MDEKMDGPVDAMHETGLALSNMQQVLLKLPTNTNQYQPTSTNMNQHQPQISLNQSIQPPIQHPGHHPHRKLQRARVLGRIALAVGLFLLLMSFPRILGRDDGENQVKDTKAY